ncbi:23710_t:CDS:2 [Gigaspora margarita]|uniref:23710_t:CDS:1 n=1 Tax=Gigaspora margarita TaxID=4874 RepID=A0ABM8W1L2_GIGMA|nr:23710_t:CDS:2 [Gigaspora margarita]
MKYKAQKNQYGNFNETSRPKRKRKIMENLTVSENLIKLFSLALLFIKDDYKFVKVSVGINYLTKNITI